MSIPLSNPANPLDWSAAIIMPSIFDFNTIAETVSKGPIKNPDWVLPPAGEGPITAIKVDGRETPNRKIEGTTVWCDITWEILDDKVRAATNLEHPTARMSFSLAMQKTTNGAYILDEGVNQNMALKAVYKACGILGDTAPNKIRNRTCWGKWEHIPMKRDGEQMLDNEGRPMYTVEVTRVTSLEAARAASRRTNGS